MTQAPPRVVATGLGLVTPLGLSVEETWRNMVAGRSGIRRIERFDPSRLTAQIAGEVRGFDASHILDRKDLRRADRYIQFGLVVAREAMDMAGLPARLEGAEAEATGVIMGTGLGGIETLFDNIITLATRGPDRLSPFLIPMGIGNVGAGQIAITFGPLGPNFATVSACASSGHAVGEAYEIIRRGDAEMMIAGGAEAGIHEGLVGGFAAMRALSTRNDEPERASRPFDRDRDGFVIAEGAGALVLESLPHAERRGAPILAEVLGYGATADASHLTLPAPGGAGAIRAARRAMQKAGIDASEIDLINAHATSTPEGDRAELQAIRTLFGDRASQIPVTANKSQIGHTLGAAGGIAAAVTILALRDGCVPPTVNLEHVDEAGEGLDLTPQIARSHEIQTALMNAFGFGGQNSALIFRRWDA